MIAPQLCFLSSLFNSSQPHSSWPALNAYGEDLAEWLRARLQCEDFTLSTPHWSSDAWVLECRRGEESDRIRVRCGGAESWVIEVARSRSWFAALVFPEPTMNRSLAEAIQSALSREPAVSQLQWKRARTTERA